MKDVKRGETPRYSGIHKGERSLAQRLVPSIYHNTHQSPQPIKRPFHLFVLAISALLLILLTPPPEIQS
jgi:hypothetical protein